MFHQFYKVVDKNFNDETFTNLRYFYDNIAHALHVCSNPFSNDYSVVRQDNDEDIQTISDASDDIVQTPPSKLPSEYISII